jgi:hypothetical protein
VLGAEFAAHVRAAEVAQKIQCNGSFHIGLSIRGGGQRSRDFVFREILLFARPHVL